MTHHDDHDTVVVDSGGSGMGAILGIIGILVLLIAVWYFALGPGASPSVTNENNNTIIPPAASLPAVEPSAAP
jgi:cbb3-type cytochrome oxidase subunit 3